VFSGRPCGGARKTGLPLMAKPHFPHLFRRLENERGVAMVEFALVAPLLFLLLFGMIDFGKAFNYWNVEQQMANQGARLAAVNAAGPWSCDGAPAPALADYIQCQAVTGELRNGNSLWLADGAKVCIDAPDGLDIGDPVQVEVKADYNWLPLIADHISVTQTRITGKATMRLEQPLAADQVGCSA
jgi:TadE-like protein